MANTSTTQKTNAKGKGTSASKSTKVTVKKKDSAENAAKAAMNKLDEKNAKKVANDTALNSRTKYVYPGDCDTPSKRKAFRAKHRAKLESLAKDIAKAKKGGDAAELKKLNAELATQLKHRPDLATEK